MPWGIMHGYKSYWCNAFWFNLSTFKQLEMADSLIQEASLHINAQRQEKQVMIRENVAQACLTSRVKHRNDALGQTPLITSAYPGCVLLKIAEKGHSRCSRGTCHARGPSRIGHPGSQTWTTLASFLWKTQFQLFSRRLLCLTNRSNSRTNSTKGGWWTRQCLL